MGAVRLGSGGLVLSLSPSLPLPTTFTLSQLLSITSQGILLLILGRANVFSPLAVISFLATDLTQGEIKWYPRITKEAPLNIQVSIYDLLIIGVRVYFDRVRRTIT